MCFIDFWYGLTIWGGCFLCLFDVLWYLFWCVLMGFCCFLMIFDIIVWWFWGVFFLCFSCFLDWWWWFSGNVRKVFWMSEQGFHNLFNNAPECTVLLSTVTRKNSGLLKSRLIRFERVVLFSCCSMNLLPPYNHPRSWDDSPSVGVGLLDFKRNCHSKRSCQGGDRSKQLSFLCV